MQSQAAGTAEAPGGHRPLCSHPLSTFSLDLFSGHSILFAGEFDEWWVHAGLCGTHRRGGPAGDGGRRRLIPVGRHLALPLWAALAEPRGRHLGAGQLPNNTCSILSK